MLIYSKKIACEFITAKLDIKEKHLKQKQHAS